MLCQERAEKATVRFIYPLTYILYPGYRANRFVMVSIRSQM